MAQAYINSGIITITLDTGIPLTGATVTKIKYQKPDGTKGEWTASVNGTSLQYDADNDDIDQAGTWQFQSYVEIAGQIGRGEIASQTFLTPL